MKMPLKVKFLLWTSKLLCISGRHAWMRNIKHTHHGNEYTDLYDYFICQACHKTESFFKVARRK